VRRAADWRRQVADASSLRVGDLVQVDPNGEITRIR